VTGRPEYKDCADSNQGVLKGGAKFGAGKAGQAFLLDGKDNFVAAGNATSADLADWCQIRQVKALSSRQMYQPIFRPDGGTMPVQS
jgi:hypothetical protein